MAKILFLYSEMMPYMESVISKLNIDFNDEVIVISWDNKNLTPYKTQFHQAIKYFPRSQFDAKKITHLIQDFSPEIIYVSGRMDKEYLSAISNTKLKAKIVMGMDNQWTSNYKQWIQILLSYFLYRQYFEYIWIPGSRQYTLARLLGFPSEKIIKNLYSGNYDLFSSIKQANNSKKKQIIFLGRLERVKGLDLLLEAWDKIDEKEKKDWELVLIGEGSLKNLAQKYDRVVLKGFLTQNEIITILEDDCIFCLPSRKEPWGVVVHEMAAAGLPLILSNAVGASDDFLINNFNGCLINELTVSSLRINLIKIMQLTPEERFAMGKKSQVLSARITPKIAAASLRSILINSQYFTEYH